MVYNLGDQNDLLQIMIIITIIIIIIISQTATQAGRAASYTSEGASRVNSPVMKMKSDEREKYKSMQTNRFYFWILHPTLHHSI